MMLKSATLVALTVLLSLGVSSGARAECDPHDRNCISRERPARLPNVGREAVQPAHPQEGVERAHSMQFHRSNAPSGATTQPGREGPASPGVAPGAPPAAPVVIIERPRGSTGSGATGEVASSSGAAPLQPVRAYLRARDIPPLGAGAYGLVVLQSRPTPANRAKLMMVCRSFVAFFPRSSESSVPVKDQMITVWPLDDPDSQQARADDCDHVLDHYDLIASEEAIRDAQKQHALFNGEGPYLVGWSPTKARGASDALVLVVDMSADNTQAGIDNKFRFWKDKIVEDPSLWRNGWSMEGIRVAIHDFVDQYGQAMVDTIKLIGKDN